MDEHLCVGGGVPAVLFYRVRSTITLFFPHSAWCSAVLRFANVFSGERVPIGFSGDRLGRLTFTLTTGVRGTREGGSATLDEAALSHSAESGRGTTALASVGNGDAVDADDAECALALLGDR